MSAATLRAKGPTAIMGQRWRAQCLIAGLIHEALCATPLQDNEHFFSQAAHLAAAHISYYFNVTRSGRNPSLTEIARPIQLGIEDCLTDFEIAGAVMKQFRVWPKAVQQ